jgi:hypothetical protein
VPGNVTLLVLVNPMTGYKFRANVRSTASETADAPPFRYHHGGIAVSSLAVLREQWVADRLHYPCCRVPQVSRFSRPGIPLPPDPGPLFLHQPYKVQGHRVPQIFQTPGAKTQVFIGAGDTAEVGPSRLCATHNSRMLPDGAEPRLHTSSTRHIRKWETLVGLFTG